MSNNKSGFSSKRADLMHTSKKKPMILEFGEDMVESTGQFKDSLVVELVKQFSQDNENSDILIPHNDEIRQLQGKLVGKIVILCGPSRCGKSSALRWALRNSHTSIVRIDCRIYSTDVQFIERLTKEIGRCLGEPLLTKSNVFTETVNFTELNNIIRLRRRQFIVLVKYAQKLTNCKKQMILYNLFEWMKTDVQKYIGVVLTFSTSFFVVGMDKRVLSRFTGKSYQLQHFSGQDVMEALALRVDILIKKKKGNRKKGITFQQNANNHISQQSKEMEILTKLSHAMHSQKVESFFVESQNSRPQNIIYFLNLFRFAITGRLRDQKLLLNMSSTKLEEELVKELEIAKEEIGEELQMERNLFIALNIPQIILMGLIRARLLSQGADKYPPITLKILYEQDYKRYQKRGIFDNPGYQYSLTVMKRALQKLHNHKFVSIEHQYNGIELGSIVSHYVPKQISFMYQKLANVSSEVQQIYSQS